MHRSAAGLLAVAQQSEVLSGGSRLWLARWTAEVSFCSSIGLAWAQGLVDLRLTCFDAGASVVRWFIPGGNLVLTLVGVGAGGGLGHHPPPWRRHRGTPTSLLTQILGVFG